MVDITGVSVRVDDVLIIYAVKVEDYIGWISSFVMTSRNIDERRRDEDVRWKTECISLECK
jgi:hypothetical protein